MTESNTNTPNKICFAEIEISCFDCGTEKKVIATARTQYMRRVSNLLQTFNKEKQIYCL